MEKTPSIVAFPAGLALGTVVNLVLAAIDSPSVWVLVGMPAWAVCILYLSQIEATDGLQGETRS